MYDNLGLDPFYFGGGGAFSPLSLSPKIFVEADYGLQKTPGGAAATADGDAVQRALDKSTNANHFTETTGGAIPFVSVDQFWGGLPSIRFFNGTEGMLSPAVFSGDYTIFLTYSPTNESGGAQRTLNGSNGWLMGNWGFPQARAYNGAFANGPDQHIGQVRTLMFRGNASGADLYVNDVFAATAAGANVPGTLGIGIEGATPDGAYGDIGAVVGFDSQIALANCTKVATYLNRWLPPSATAAPKIVAFEGDSITRGYIGGSVNLTQRWATLAAASAGATKYHVYAVSGSKTDEVTGRAYAVDDAYSASRTKNNLVVLLGANDLQAVSAATFVANLKTYCLARIAAGWTVIVCTVLPSTISGFNTKRNTANTAIRGDTSFYTSLIDFALDGTYGTDAAASDGSLYPDGLHPSAAVHTLMAATASPVISAALA